MQALATSLRLLLALIAFSLAVSAQGVILREDSMVLYGSAANCTQPASVDFQKLKKATPEWKTIRSEGVQKGTARYDLLVDDMNRRIKRLCEEVAKATGKDCILCKGDVENDRGLEVVDLTSQLLRKIESED